MRHEAWGVAGRGAQSDIVNSAGFACCENVRTDTDLRKKIKCLEAGRTWRQFDVSSLRVGLFADLVGHRKITKFSSH
eukprot:882286-Amphidinium_carterae.1